MIGRTLLNFLFVRMVSIFVVVVDESVRWVWAGLWHFVVVWDNIYKK
jgi:hypothetical protein